jgi:Putative methyltransferase
MQKLSSYEALKRPLPIWHPKAIYYGTFKLLLETIGQLSDGIRLGLQYGFDSGVMLEYIYRNQPSGRTFIGKAIDRIYLNAVGWRGIRQRGEILKGILRQTIHENYAQGITTHLLDVACGGGRSLLPYETIKLRIYRRLEN